MKAILTFIFIFFFSQLFANNNDSVKDSRLSLISKAIEKKDYTKEIEIESLSINSNYHNDSINLAYQKFNLIHWKRSFAWQYYSSIVIFILVVMIVLFGLYLSYYQFSLVSNMIKKNEERNDKIKLDTTNIEILKADLEIHKDGVKISTAVVGLVILVISIVFFFLYLKFVYPIHMLS